MNHFVENKKQIYRYAFAFLLLLTVCLCNAKSGQAAVKNLSVKAKCSVKKSGNTHAQVELYWGWEKADIYRIYRASYNEDKNKIGKYKKIATISGKKTSYRSAAKHKKSYYYKVVGYVKKSGRYVKKYSSSIPVAPMGNVHYESDPDYFLSGVKITPNYIKIANWDINDYSMENMSLELYRREVGTSKYKRLKTLSYKSGWSYVDKTVKTGKTYQYRCRLVKTYQKNKKTKKLYSKYSKAQTLSAINESGQFSVSVVPQSDTTSSSLILCVKSGAGNGVTKFGRFTKTFQEVCHLTSSTIQTSALESVGLYLTAGSYDLNQWTDLTTTANQLSLPAGGTVYLKLQTSDGNALPVSASDTSILIQDLSCMYDQYSFGFSCDISKGTGVAQYIGN